MLLKWAGLEYFYNWCDNYYSSYTLWPSLVQPKSVWLFPSKWGILHSIWEFALLQISPEDIRWEGGDPGITHRSGQGPQGRGVKRTTGRGGSIPSAGKGRGSLKNQKKRDFPPSQNGISKKTTGDIEILDTNTLIKEVCAWQIDNVDPYLHFIFNILVHPRWRSFLVQVILILLSLRKPRKCWKYVIKKKHYEWISCLVSL